MKILQFALISVIIYLIISLVIFLRTPRFLHEVSLGVLSKGSFSHFKKLSNKQGKMMMIYIIPNEEKKLNLTNENTEFILDGKKINLVPRWSSFNGNKTKYLVLASGLHINIEEGAVAEISFKKPLPCSCEILVKYLSRCERPN